jgi:hypothetical protein
MREGFKAGLRPLKEVTRNTGTLVDGMNLLPGKLSLLGYSPDVENMPKIYTSVGVEIDMSIKWPFPQLFQTDTGLYVGNKDGIYQVAYDGTYGLVGTSLASGYTTGVKWPWTCANCPGFPMFASGDLLVYYDPDLAAWAYWAKGVGGAAGPIWNSDWYQPISMCYSRGQMLAAGSKTYTTFPSQNRKVMWSQIGQAKFLEAPTTHAEMLDSVINTAGFHYEGSDDYGILMRVLPLEKAFIVYGTFSIFALIPVSDPAPTFAVVPLLDVGIANPLAVGGPIKGESAGKQLFVDRLGVLWEMGSGQGKPAPKRLGYEEFLAPMQSDISIANGTGLISLSYNPYKDEYYISNGKKSYVYNGVGMTPIDKCITSMVDFQKAQVTTGFHYTALQDAAYGYYYKVFSGSDLSLCTDVIDMRVTAIKTLEVVHLGMMVPEGATVECMVEWRNDKSKSFRKTPWKRVSPAGSCAPMVSGVEFRLWVKCSSWNGFELSDITVGWKLVDKHSIRGAYAGDTTPGASA